MSALLPLPVAPTTPRVARSVRGVVESDVAELDRASRPGEREMLRRLGGDDFRLHVEDLEQSSHRCFATLKEVDDPAKRNHRPGEHRQVHAEGDERTDRYSAVDGEGSAGPEHDHRAESAEEGEQRIESAPQANQRHVESQIRVVECAKSIHLGRLLAIGADDPRSGQILLSVGG
jgi:hypothetical protein